MKTVRHLRLVTWTACGLKGIDGRGIAATIDRDRVTCERCRKSPSFKTLPFKVVS